MLTKQLVQALTINLNNDDEVAAVEMLVNRVKATAPENMGETFTSIATWFVENWEVTIYEGNQYAANIVTAAL